VKGFVDDRNRAFIAICVANGLKAERSAILVWIDTAFEAHGIKLHFAAGITEGIRLIRSLITSTWLRFDCSFKIFVPLNAFLASDKCNKRRFSFERELESLNNRISAVFHFEAKEESP